MKTIEKIKLLKPKPMPQMSHENPIITWKSSLPFVENDRAVLVHRPKHITTHKNGNRPAHTAIHYYCGTVTFVRKGVTFLSAPKEDSLLCTRCEQFAVEAGLPTASSLAGNHVHTGKVIGVKTCCDELPISKDGE